jgi:hypothetical protein
MDSTFFDVGLGGDTSARLAFDAATNYGAGSPKDSLGDRDGKDNAVPAAAIPGGNG